MQRWAGFRLKQRIVIVMLAVLFSYALFLLPSFKTNDYTVQITTRNDGKVLPDGFYLYQSLAAKGIAINSITQENNRLIIHFSSVEKRNNAAVILKKLLIDGYSIS